ncbi:MAG: hypothetical protein RIQ81_2525 [Pseudomonadota bacterium]|jgi:hypothetical protein
MVGSGQNLGGTGRQMPLPTSQWPSTTGGGAQPAPDVSSGSANFSQYGGYFYHPQKQGRANLRNGRLDVDISAAEVRVSLGGLSADSKEGDVRNGAAGINGLTVYSRVPASSLPPGAEFQKAPFLIFSNAVRNNKGALFTTGPGEFFPAFALAGGSEGDFASLTPPGASLRYPVTFTAPDGRGFRTTIVVQRVTKGNGPCGEFSGFTPLLARGAEYFGLKIELSPPPGADFANGFPVGTTFYAVRYANGGIVSNLGSCSVYWDDKQKVSGYVRLEFNR